MGLTRAQRINRGYEKIHNNYINFIKNNPLRFQVQSFSKWYILDRDTMNQVGESFDTLEEAQKVANEMNRKEVFSV